MMFKIKNITGSIVFLLGLLVLLNMASLIFQPKNNTEKHGMEDQRANGILAEPENTIDVLFIGDSVSYCSVIPIQIWRDHGITSYLCGTSLQQLYYSKEFLIKAFAAQTPKVVILETIPVFNNFEYKENIANAIERKFPLVRYHDRWKQFLEEGTLDESFRVNYTNREVTKGYYYSSAIEVVEPGDYTKPTEEVAGILADCKRTLKEIAAYCEKKGAKLILLNTPNTLTWRPDCHNAIVLLAEELNLEYVDMNYLSEEVAMDWSKDSFDGGDHLNYYGAQKVTAYLGKYLENMGIFEDKRTDNRYESWNEDTGVFYESIVK